MSSLVFITSLCFCMHMYYVAIQHNWVNEKVTLRMRKFFNQPTPTLVGHQAQFKLSFSTSQTDSLERVQMLYIHPRPSRQSRDEPV